MARFGLLPPTNLKIWLGSLKTREALQTELSHSELELLREVRVFFSNPTHILLIYFRIRQSFALDFIFFLGPILHEPTLDQPDSW